MANQGEEEEDAAVLTVGVWEVYLANGRPYFYKTDGSDTTQWDCPEELKGNPRVEALLVVVEEEEEDGDGDEEGEGEGEAASAAGAETEEGMVGPRLCVDRCWLLRGVRFTTIFPCSHTPRLLACSSGSWKRERKKGSWRTRGAAARRAS